MAFTGLNTQLRDQKTNVKKSHTISLIGAILRFYQRRKIPHIRTVTDRQARDIGMSQTEMAPHQYRLPSQHSHHPRG